MTTTKLTVGQSYDLDTLEFAGWSTGADHVDGYHYADYFRDGIYLGADEDGVEPIFAASAPINAKAIATSHTLDGLRVYDLDPASSELWAVAGPAGIDPRTIDWDNLPAGFRWVTDAEWAALQG